MGVLAGGFVGTNMHRGSAQGIKMILMILFLKDGGDSKSKMCKY